MKTLIYMLLALAISALPVLAQGPGGPGGRNPGSFLDRMKTDLGLTDSQVQQLQPLFTEQRQRDQARHEAVRNQLEAVLTPDQKVMLSQRGPGSGRPPEGRPQDGAKRPNPLADLNLTADQQARIEQILTGVHQQEGSERAAFEARLTAVLTADQQARWQQLHQQRHH